MILAAAWRRMSFKQRDALVLAAAANPHGRGCAIQLLKPDSWMSRTDGYPRFCRRARSRHKQGLQRRCYCGARDGVKLVQRCASGRALIVFFGNVIDRSAAAAARQHDSLQAVALHCYRWERGGAGTVYEAFPPGLHA